MFWADILFIQSLDICFVMGECSWGDLMTWQRIGNMTDDVDRWHDRWHDSEHDSWGFAFHYRMACTTIAVQPSTIWNCRK